jgi:hypothetical protein
MLCSTDKQFPIHLWDRLIPQAVITLNLLHQSRLNPKLPAHAQLNGPFKYNATPIAPPGTRVILHDKPEHRGSWSPHGLNTWYVGPAMEHYRAHQVYCSTTGHKGISDTNEFFPTTLCSSGDIKRRRGHHCGSRSHPRISKYHANHTVPTTGHGAHASNKKVSRHLQKNGTTTRANTTGGYNTAKYQPTSKGGNSANTQIHDSKDARNTNTTPSNDQ